MDMITIKEYADSQNVTYEAVRKQVVRYKDDLKGHIVTNNRTQFLDEWAVKFLTERRREHPVILINQGKDEAIEELTQQIESLRAKLLTAQNELITSKDRIIALQDEARAGIEDRTKYQLLLSDHEEQGRKLREAEDALREKEDEIQSGKEIMRDLQNKTEEQGKQIEELRKEADSYERTFFGLYRKRKEN